MRLSSAAGPGRVRAAVRVERSGAGGRCSIRLRWPTPAWLILPRCVNCTTSTHVPRMSERIPSRLWPDREAVRLLAYRNLRHRARGRVDRVDHVVVTTRQPQQLAV